MRGLALVWLCVGCISWPRARRPFPDDNCIRVTGSGKSERIWKGWREVPLDRLLPAVADVPAAKRAAERADRSRMATVLALPIGASLAATVGQVALGIALFDHVRPTEQQVLVGVGVGSGAAGMLTSTVAGIIWQQQTRRAVARYDEEKCR